MGEITIDPKGHFTHEEVANGIDPVEVDQPVRLHDILEGF